MTGYTTAEAARIMDNARILSFDPQNPFYAVLAELNRRLICKHDTRRGRISEQDRSFWLLVSAYAAGRAVGNREERARRRGEELEPLPQSEIEKADAAIEDQRRTDEFMELFEKLSEADKDAMEARMVAMASDGDRSEEP